MGGVAHPPQRGWSATESACPSSYERRGPAEPMMSADSAEMGRAVDRCTFPLFVWTADGVVHLANDAAAVLLGEPLSAVVGDNVIDRLSPRHEVERVKEALFTGALVGSQSKRVVSTTDGQEVPVWIWTRVLELDGVRAAASLTVPTSELARLGRHPDTPWRDLVGIAVGIADSHWIIEAVSHDASGLVGYDVAQLVGRSFVDLVHPDYVSSVMSDKGGPPTSPITIPGIKIRNENGEWTKVCLLSAPLPDGQNGGALFAIVGALPASWSSAERVTELEMRLRRIGAEVRAAGIIENVSTLRPHADHPELTDLTTRQWEILSLLLEGLRVPAIASHLYLSPSTVRNHLATIFRKFGVHSQSELLELLRRPTDQAEG